ncbi:MAG: PDZ domain-containing protein, partial [Pyrinomonadaceae bacterium]|nr:PDZ domain-containing protein [Pyrinomonadaceae bacterium]
NEFKDGDKNVTFQHDVYIQPFKLSLNEDGFGPSDHSSFYGKQIPVLFFFTGTHEDYHKPSDTAEKINYDGLLKITNYVGEIVKSIDGNVTKPTYAVAKSSGMMGGRTGFSVSLGTVPSYSDSSDGMTIDAVRDNSPAAKTGLKAGDKVVKLAGKDVRNVQDYTFVLGEMKAGEEYEIVVVRGAERLTLKIVPAARK